MGIHYTACSNSWQAGKLSLIPPARKQLRSRQTTILYTGTYRDRGKKILFIYNSYGWSHFVILLGSYDLIMVFPNKKNCVWNICLEYVQNNSFTLTLIIKREYCAWITGRVKGTVQRNMWNFFCQRGAEKVVLCSFLNFLVESKLLSFSFLE